MIVSPPHGCTIVEFLDEVKAVGRLKPVANEDVQEKLRAQECRWDLIVWDEAHNATSAYGLPVSPA